LSIGKGSFRSLLDGGS